MLLCMDYLDEYIQEEEDFITELQIAEEAKQKSS